MYSQALRVTLALALFKGGPQDMPYSQSLTRMAVVLAIASTVLLLSGVVPMSLALATGVGGVAGVAFFTRQVLRSRRLENRFAQTLVSQLMVGSLFALAMWPAFLAMAPAMQAMMEAMRTMAASGGDAAAVLGTAEQEALQPPAWAALWSDVLFIWSLVASARIHRLAADVNRLSSWLLTLMSVFVLLGFIMLAQFLAALLFAVT